MNEEDKREIIQSFNIRIGDDINNLGKAYQIENELIARRDALQSSLRVVNTEVPTEISASIDKAKKNSSQIAELKTKNETLYEKIDNFLTKTEPLRNELDRRFAAIDKLEKVLCYLKSYEGIDNLCSQLSTCTEDEQCVQLYSELKDLCIQYQEGHRGTYVKEYTHYWHNILKDRLTKQYEDVLKQLKWPVVTGTDNPPLPKDVMVRFYGLTKFLFLIEEPDDEQARMLSGDFSLENPCLPVKILLRPLKKRFTFHFTGPRQTARLDRPEWFLTQTLTWIKDHQGFVKSHLQPVADKLNIRHIRTVAEFNAGLISFAAERLHTVLGLYNTQGTKNENIADTDAAFAHAVDEALGFHRELILLTGHEANSVLSVLTKAEIFVRWLAVEKKYALAKMDETLDNEQWSEPIVGGNGFAVGTVMWVPRGADWFIALLKTIEDRYAVLPQPGHRLQFLELQLELVEEWRVRLTQIMSAALGALEADWFLAGGARDPLSAVVNAAHHSREVLLQWAHSLHYLQLHYYRRQFQHFTQQQHHDASESSSGSDGENDDDDKRSKEKTDSEDEALSLKDVEQKAKNLALDEVTRRNSTMPELSQFDITSPTGTRSSPELTSQAAEEAGVWAEAPGLLARLRDAGLKALVDHAFMEFKAAMRDYRRQKWHAMLVVEENALCVSAPLCRPLSALCARLATASARLAPALSVRLRGCLAENVDAYIFEEVVLESWFNTGGTMQFTHDVKRNLVPAFAPPKKSASQVNYLPKLIESCKLLNMEYEDARSLRSLLKKPSLAAKESLLNQGIRVLEPAEALRILNQRTDLSDEGAGSVMDLF